MMTTTRSLAAAALTLAVLAAPRVADAQTIRYRVVQLAEIASAETSCVPTAINANGDVVGYCGAGGDAAFAVLWRGGTVVNLGRLDRGTFSHAFNISAAGDIIVSDRYRASSIAYGEAQGLDAVWLDEIQRGLPIPGITVLLDIAPETAVSRKSAGRDKYERDLELLARVRTSYQRQAAAQGWVRINAEAGKDEVARLVEAAVLPRFVRR